MSDDSDQLWEVFIRTRRGTNHVHCGSLRATDSDQALLRARDLFTRRLEGVSLWAAPSKSFVVSEPEKSAELFDPAIDKTYRDPSNYAIPQGVDTI